MLGHPVLRNISLMMALVNFVASTTSTQLVLFAKQRLAASERAGGPALLGGQRRRDRALAGRRAAAETLALQQGGAGRADAGRPADRAFAADALVLACAAAVGAVSGLGILFNINTGSLRQAIVPNHMLGRVMSIAGVLAWSAIPVGTFLGGVPSSVPGTWRWSTGIGVLTFLIPLGFSFTPLGHAERYLPSAEEEPAAGEPVAAVG